MPGKTATSLSVGALKKLCSLDLGDYVNHLSWSPDGQKLLAAAANGEVAVFDAARATPYKRWHAHEFGALTCGWSADGTLVATAGQDGTAIIYNAESLDPLAFLDHGADWVEHLAWAPSNNVMLTAAGKSLRLWTESGRLIEEYQVHASTISGVKWHPVGGDIFASCCYGAVHFWRVGTTQPARTLKWKGSLLTLEYSPNGRVVACGCQDGAVHVWLLPSGNDLEMSGYPTKVRELSWDSKSRFLATGGGQEIIVWDFSGKGPSGSKPIVLSAHESFISFLSFQPGCVMLASADQSGRLCLWNPPANKQPIALSDLRSTISKLAWQPKGNLLASGCSSGEIDIWSSETIA